MMKISILKGKKNATYVKMSFVIIKSKEWNLNCTNKFLCHLTGKFRGAAHSICNLHYKVPQDIPVKIHNGSKYDSTS